MLWGGMLVEGGSKCRSWALALAMVVCFGTGLTSFTGSAEESLVVDPTILWVDGPASFYNYDVEADSQGHVHILHHSMETLAYSTNLGGYFGYRYLGWSQGGPLGAMVLDPRDDVHLCYVIVNEEDSTPEIHYATGSEDSWNDLIIDKGEVGLADDSLALDTEGNPHIAYLIEGSELRFAERTNGFWTNGSIDQVGIIGYSIATDTMDHMYVCYQTASNDLKIAYRDDDAWSIQTIVTGDVRSALSSITVDGQDLVHISYQSVRGELKYVTNGGGDWQVTTIQTGMGDHYSSMAVSEQGHAHMIYWRSGGDLGYATNFGGDWRTEIIVDDTEMNGAYLAVDPQDNAHVTYGNMGLDSIMYATNLGGSWNHAIILHVEDSMGETAGPLTVDAKGQVHIVYGMNNVYYATFAPQMKLPPGPVTELKVTPADGEVRLSWTSPSSNGGTRIDHYIIYQDGLDVAHVDGTRTTITGLTNGIVYNFSVAAHNEAGIGAVEQVVSVMPSISPDVPSSPTGLNVTRNDGKVQLSWTIPSDNAQNITGFRVYRGTSPSTMALLALVEGTTFLDETVSVNRTYYYKVSAVTSVSESDPSSEVHVTVAKVSELTPSFFDTLEGKFAIAGLFVCGGGTVAYAL